jgi:imidazolonepropionase-like amidohydrolase
VIEDGVIVSKATRFARWASVACDSGRMRAMIDASGKTIVPAYVDAHAHVAISAAA